ncbi:hypothetical protein DSECCO2_593590 [anaerobic digester metagenome]
MTMIIIPIIPRALKPSNPVAAVALIDINAAPCRDTATIGATTNITKKVRMV